MKKQHRYQITVQWTGNKGTGTDNYDSYERSHFVTVEGKPPIFGSSDAAFRGDAKKHNPEDLLVSALSACHMLWYLHLCAEEGVIVQEYIDNTIGTMEESQKGGKFIEVILNPSVIVKELSMVEKAKKLHKQASELCFIANSVNFPVRHNALITAEEA